jgi:hypothetical protein
MMLIIKVTQALIGDMGVYLGCRDITVSEQHLYDPQICTVVQQMCRKGMAQGVRRQFFRIYAGVQRVALYHVPECLPCHCLASLGDKNGIRSGRFVLQ